MKSIEQLMFKDNILPSVQAKINRVKELRKSIRGLYAEYEETRQPQCLDTIDRCKTRIANLQSSLGFMVTEE